MQDFLRSGKESPYWSQLIQLIKSQSTVEMNHKIEPFPNLSRAGEELAATLQNAGVNSDVIVLAIVSAGVPVSVEVAKHLQAALDLVIIRRLLTPTGPGSQSTAVNVAGTAVVDDDLGKRSGAPQTPFDYFMDDALAGLSARAQLCRGERPPTELAGKSVLLVDCGIRSGLTMQAAIGAVRTLNPSRITAAVPVTSVDGRRIVEPLADKLIYLYAPDPFVNAGKWFRDFGRPDDDRISGLLKSEQQ